MPVWVWVLIVLVVALVSLWIVKRVAGLIHFRNAVMRLTMFFSNDLNKWHSYQEVQAGSQVEAPMLGWLLYKFYEDGMLFRRLDQQKQHVGTTDEVLSSTDFPEVALAPHFEYKANPPKLKVMEEYFQGTGPLRGE